MGSGTHDSLPMIPEIHVNGMGLKGQYVPLNFIGRTKPGIKMVDDLQLRFLLTHNYTLSCQYPRLPGLFSFFSEFLYQFLQRSPGKDEFPTR